MMGLRRCSRCGRTDDHPADTSSGSEAAPWTWASFDGVDVCPDCQTPEDRLELAHRTITLTQAAMERRSSDNVPPEEGEQPVIALAMALREWLEAQTAAEKDKERDAQPAVGHDPRPDPQERTRLRVAITGAFLTGPALDIRLEHYPDEQSALACELRLHGWRVDELRSNDGTFESGGGFVKRLPIVFARGGLEALQKLRDYLDDPSGARRAALTTAAPGFRFEATHLTIDIYDLGVGVFTAWLDVSAPPELTLPAVARTVKELALLNKPRSPIGQALVQIAHTTASQYQAALRSTTDSKTGLQSAWPASAVSADDYGRLLWLHPVYVLDAESSSEQLAGELAPVFRQFVSVNDGVFVPGIGWSAIVRAPASGADAMPIRLTELHWAFFALYMVMDRGLVAVLNEARWTESHKLKELERSAAAAFDVYLRVMEARARLDSELSALGGDELAVWEAIADLQRFDTIVGGVERKIETLERLTERRVDRAAAVRSRRVSEILGSLTALTFLTVAVALFGYFAGTRAGGDVEPWIRIAVVAVAVTLALSILWLTFGLPRPRASRRAAAEARKAETQRG